jgi:hypothetical protein
MTYAQLDILVEHHTSGQKRSRRTSRSRSSGTSSTQDVSLAALAQMRAH